MTEGSVEDMGIVEFLRARLDEDEADAREADGSRWLHEDKVVTFQFWNAEHGDMDWDTLVSTDTRANGYHIARHDPARVLREVQSKRQMLDDIEANDYFPAAMVTDGLSARWLYWTAAIYADHPDYDPEWALDTSDTQAGG